MATIIHFDISVDDTDRAKKFYSSLFDWKFTELPGPVPYFLIETRDLKGNPGTGGGMAKRTIPSQSIVNFIGVASIDESMAKVKALGGRIVQEKQDVPGFGLLAVFVDTENNTIGLFEEIVKTETESVAGSTQMKMNS